MKVIKSIHWPILWFCVLCDGIEYSLSISKHFLILMTEATDSGRMI